MGAAIGIGLDRWLKTSPWFTILFFLLGVAAGFMNMLRDLKRWGR
ncbi:MAG: AtpZ/AtpI family protein [Burkholderiales bacterium]